MYTKYFTRFHCCWNSCNVEPVRKVGGFWGCKTSLPKQNILEYIDEVFDNPEAIDLGIKRMSRAQFVALKLLRLMNGHGRVGPLDIAIIAGLPQRPLNNKGTPRNSVSEILVSPGIVAPNYDEFYFDYSYRFDRNSNLVFCDERILDRIPPFIPDPYDITPASAPDQAVYRRAVTVVLDLVSVINTVQNAGQLHVKGDGSFGISDVRRIAKKLKWEATVDSEGLEFPSATACWLAAMEASRFLVYETHNQVRAIALSEFEEMNTIDAIQKLLGGFVRSECEITGSNFEPAYANSYDLAYAEARYSLITALMCLPEKFSWYLFSDFEKCIYERIGLYHCVNRIRMMERLVDRFSAYSDQEEDTERNQACRQNWEKYQIPWLHVAFRTWLYRTGIVELSFDNSKAPNAGEAAPCVDRFRLTDIGRSILYHDLYIEPGAVATGAVEAQGKATAIIVGEPPLSQSPPKSKITSPWIVQPNFDLLAFVDEVSARQITFLESVAERISVSDRTISYKLSRNSIYIALQRGSTLVSIIDGLTAGSGKDLPTNVVAEIKTWAARLDKISITKSCSLIECETSEGCKTLLANGVTGRIVGERYLLVENQFGTSKKQREGVLVIDYIAQPRKQSILFSEDGVIFVPNGPMDLRLLSVLKYWASNADTDIIRGQAESISSNVPYRGWKLTKKSVTNALANGRPKNELENTLNLHGIFAPGGLFYITLKSWMGEKIDFTTQEIISVSCSSPEVITCLYKTPRLKKIILGRLGETAILVSKSDLEIILDALMYAEVNITAL